VEADPARPVAVTEGHRGLRARVAAGLAVYPSAAPPHWEAAAAGSQACRIRVAQAASPEVLSAADALPAHGGAIPVRDRGSSVRLELAHRVAASARQAPATPRRQSPRHPT